MAHIYGKFIWFEHMSGDVPKARQFYADLLGWTSEGENVGDQMYHMIQNNGEGIGGFRQAPEGVPSHWFSYLSVADVDASADALVKAGGKMLMQPTDFSPVGRGAMVTDPQGAAFSIWRGYGDDRADVEQPVAGDWCWNELMTKDAAAASQFYQSVFAYDIDIMPMPQGDYHVLKTGVIPRAGIMDSPDNNMPSHWLPYIYVEDCDATHAKAVALGAQILVEPMDIPEVGRMCMIQDPTGAMLGIIRLNSSQ